MLSSLTILLAIESVFGFTLQPITKHSQIAPHSLNLNKNSIQKIGTLPLNATSQSTRTTPTIPEETIIQKNQFTLDHHYTGRNQKLKQWEFTEPSFNFPFSGTIDDFIQIQRYKAGDVWWLSPGVVADITSKNSKSPLKVMYGPESFREIYWPNDGHNGADISQFRIAVNCVGTASNYMEKSVEIFFKNPKTGEPEPFMYVYDGKPGKGEWTPVKEVFGTPIKEFCLTCHQNKNGALVAFPKVIFNSLKGISRSGYHPDFWELLISDESYWES